MQTFSSLSNYLLTPLCYQKFEIIQSPQKLEQHSNLIVLFHHVKSIPATFWVG